ncbi:hypothetical protein [Geofilum rubicundum]|uniref:Uncharacterized protein n=1 Tax=Geofilum rubicundum JCM 15548 TaxID=1236989 RepID=A0A0E9LUI6_9BACT|nr:hypothetical protein [Geofilum rubicundum]GAO28811.1 hypothetical protein JCM15548_1942 [Geofilum rubicundum JCM 15548]
MRKYSLISIVWVLTLLFMACDPQEMDDYELGQALTEDDVAFSVSPKADQPMW